MDKVAAVLQAAAKQDQSRFQIVFEVRQLQTRVQADFLVRKVHTPIQVAPKKFPQNSAGDALDQIGVIDKNAIVRFVVPDGGSACRMRCALAATDNPDSALSMRSMRAIEAAI